MKRYEQMSKEKIIELTLHHKKCDCCPCIGDFCDLLSDEDCEYTIEKWLGEEIETVPRFKTLSTVEDLAMAQEQYKNEHFDYTLMGFVEWLGEEVEK